MITIQETPAVTGFSGNPSLFKVQGSNYLAQAGRKCSFFLVVTIADLTTGHWLTFTFPNSIVTLISSATPDDSGYQFQTPVTTSFSAFAQTLYNCCQSNFELTSKFKMTLGPATSLSRIIQFEAFEIGTESSALVTMNLVTVSEILFISGLNAMENDNYCVVGGIWDANFKQLAQDIKPVDQSGEAIFNFAEYLSALQEYNQQPRFTYPFDPTAVLKIFNNYVLQYFAGFAERYSGIVRKIYFAPLHHSLAGGLNRETLVYYNQQEQNFFEVEEIIRSFMTWAPLSKITDKTVPEKLFFYVGPNPAYGLLMLEVKVHFSDGTTACLDPVQVDTLADNVIECSIGYEALRLSEIFPSNPIKSWEIWLETEAGLVVSETRSFINDPITYDNERIFIFQNSFGHAYDVIRFTGKGSVDINLTFATASSELLEEATSFNAPSYKFDASEGQKMKANSGWITREMKDYLRDLALSHQVFEYKDGLLYPIVIINEAIKEHFIDNEYLYSLDLEYDRAYRDFFFSRMPVMLFQILTRFYSDDYEDSYS